MTYEKGGLFIDLPHLGTFAENFARGVRLSGTAGGRQAAAELRRALAKIDDCRDAMSLKWEGVPGAPGAVHWLLDNHYLAKREALGAIAEIGPASGLRASDGRCLFIRVADAIVRSGLGSVDAERVETFLLGAQKALILTTDELRLLVPGMIHSLVLRIAQLCSKLDEPETETELAAAFESLRYLAGADLTKTLERADYTEQALCRDPAGIYPGMARQSRAAYRRALAALARQRGVSEYKAALKLLSLAKDETGLKSHVGYWIYTCPLGGKKLRSRGGPYIAVNLLASLFISLLLGFSTKSPLTSLLVLVPVSELVKSVTDFVLLQLCKPTHLPRMALDGGVPPEGKTLCAVSVILSTPEEAGELALTLRRHYFVSRGAGDNLLYALIADFPDTGRADIPEARAALEAAARAVEELNRSCGGHFFLLARERVMAPGGRFMGWERKRGALTETMRFLRGEASGIRCAAGDPKALEDVRFLLALDVDTRLSPGAALSLVGAMLHPMNRSVIDYGRNLVSSGHAIIAPRVGTELGSATATDFARVFAPQGGTDPYCSECSELYMDLWRSGGFAGKGIIDIDAYLACAAPRFPENLILSHDAPEGAFLRCGYMSDVELTDGFPSKPLAYYKRSERWIRGDWQNAVWLGKRGRGLRSIERFRLFDSMRRSLVPLTVFASVLAGLLCPEKLSAAAIAAVAAFASQLILTSIRSLFQSDDVRGSRYHSRLYIGMGGGLVRTLLGFILLPYEAWISLSAICRALWRMLITKKNLLAWQTSGQSRGGGGLAAHYVKMWFAPAAGLALLLWSPSVIGKAIGAIWLLSPLCALLLALPSAPKKTLTAPDRRYLTDCAGEIWRYFDEFLTPEDNFLPPDNFQPRPPAGLAHRTSPTNIGLALLSMLAAADLDVADTGRVFSLMEKCLGTVEKLEKWHGHLYNWYDTRTLEPLKPGYISTVDSGNLCAALIALRAGLEEYGRHDLARRAAALSDAMSFAPLYDEERELFFIGLEPGSDKAPTSWYDLMASEARLTAYLAVARGDVPDEHWRKLSRAQLRFGPYRGLASWTGTMFEYLMPELLLPLRRESLIWESARFCLYVQRRRAAGEPWGVSESAYYALDPSLSYRYKAHGCAHLALKRGMDSEYVVSPYSSFLALPVQPAAAMANLRRLEGMGMKGPYGFWEALDFTQGRRFREKPGPVRCVMAHHLGMSMVSCANALRGGIMVRRFMADGAMDAFSPLLEEKVPIGGTVMRQRPLSAPQKPPRIPDRGYATAGEGADFLEPRCCLLASRSYSLLVSETGLCRGSWGRIAPYTAPDSPLEQGNGVDITLEAQGEFTPLLPDIRRDNSGFSWRFGPDQAEFDLSRDGVSSALTISLGQDEIGERRRIELKNRRKAMYEGTLRISLLPLMAQEIDYVNHPSFYGLGISAKERDGCLILRRLARGKSPELYMCIASSQPCRFTLGSAGIYGRAAAVQQPGPEEQWTADPAVSLLFPVKMAPGGGFCLDTAIALDHSEAGAIAAAGKLLDLERHGAAELPRSAAAVLGMGPAEVERAFRLLPKLCFPAVSGSGQAGPKNELWRFGISGDEPIVCADCFAEDQLQAARELMDAHLFLSGCGREFDLVFFTHDGAGYRKAVRTALGELLHRSGGEILDSARGGVHIVDDTEDTGPIRAAAALCLDLGAPAPAEPRKTDFRSPLTPSGPPPAQEQPDFGWAEDGQFSFQVDRSMPGRSWQNLLSNGRFGYIATDCGSGNMWFKNARENQISPWPGSAKTVSGPEKLFLRRDGALTSLFASPSGDSCRVSFGFGTAVWEKKTGGSALRLTAFVPPETDARVFIIDCDSSLEGDSLVWRCALMCCGDQRDAKYCVTARDGDILTAANGRAMAQALPFSAMSSPRFSGFTCARASAEVLDFDGRCGAIGPAEFALEIPLERRTVIVCGCGEPEALRALCSPDGAAAALERTRRFWAGFTGKFRCASGHEALDRIMNGWIEYQAMACRIMGRCSLYQSGGAVGFRDQLQDAVNLISLAPRLCREQILSSCRHQYVQGDVMHWWHEGGDIDRGVRTRCSDDLLWLPWAVSEYVEKTGDRDILAQRAEYLGSPVLADSEGDRYEEAKPSQLSETVAEHCMRALGAVMARGTGSHGLLRIGSGDWNDGFDRVGGESQWLSWFFIICLRRFAPIAKALGLDISQAENFAESLLASCESSWDGQWYRRGYYADGRPLGSSVSGECRIDSIAQSFAALCPGADGERASTALSSALKKLYDRKSGLVALFTPPFAGQERPGYIASYGPGFRENGGQYTHGALWLALALLRSGRAGEGWEILKALLPAGKDPAKYLAEPYVIAADVYSAAGHRGEAGWSWYTGSAGWLYRIVTEEVFGLRLRAGRLYIEPRLPEELRGAHVEFLGHTIDYGDTVTLDGAEYAGGGVEVGEGPREGA